MDKVQNFSNTMSGINSYGNELDFDLTSDQHREFIGGMWQEIGELQYKFILGQGLQPENTLLDIGCGCLRGGIKFINYLVPGNYYGLDINRSLINAANYEIKRAGLENKNPHLVVDDKFAIDQFQQQFDYMLAVSLFTHLPFNNIVRCLSAVQQNLAAHGKFFATFFVVDHSVELKPTLHNPGDVTTYYDVDPFHYSLEEIGLMANLSGLKMHYFGDWQHPRSQKMIEFNLS